MIHQIKNALKQNGVPFCLFTEFFHLKTCHLVNRSVVRVQGTESAEFLQGLITNDIFHLTKNSGIFAMFLNNQGRVMFDTYFYKQE